MARNKQQGAVSIFAVIFAALLLTVLTVGFISLMISGQQRAISSDLSQSAYDAALAGVEDAKRVVRACADGDAQACTALEAADNCRVIAAAGIVADDGEAETIIRSQSGEGEQFDQAYTCVKIAMDTPDYLAEARENRAEVIPLRAADEFNRIVVEWYTQDDAGVGNVATAPSGPTDSNILPPKDAWGATTPPLMRAQVITPGETFQLSDLDGSSASRTVFLRPLVMNDGPTGDMEVVLNAYSRATDGATYSNQPSPLSCSRNFANDGYSCRAVLEFEDAVSPAASANALLRLDSIYKGANLRVTLFNGSSPVSFEGVQPTVDATGRANNLFRRVEARLRMGEDFNYPSYVVDIANSLCKDFSVGADNAQPGRCEP